MAKAVLHLYLGAQLLWELMMARSLAKPLHSLRESPLIPELTVGFPVAPQHHITVAVVHSLDIAVYKQQCCYIHSYSRYSQRDSGDHH